MNLREILESDTISYNDKVETACKVLPSFLLVAWAADCAESVVHLYEQEYPQDKRPRQAIEAARNGDCSAAARAAAHAAAYAAYAATYAANAASAAAYATSAAYAAAHAAYAAAYAAEAASHAAYAAAHAADAAESAANVSKNTKTHQELLINLLLKQVEIYESPLYKALQEE